MGVGENPLKKKGGMKLRFFQCWGLERKGKVYYYFSKKRNAIMNREETVGRLYTQLCTNVGPKREGAGDIVLP